VSGDAEPNGNSGAAEQLAAALRQLEAQDGALIAAQSTGGRTQIPLPALSPDPVRSGADGVTRSVSPEADAIAHRIIEAAAGHAPAVEVRRSAPDKDSAVTLRPQGPAR